MRGTPGVRKVKRRNKESQEDIRNDIPECKVSIFTNLTVTRSLASKIQTPLMHIYPNHPRKLIFTRSFVQYVTRRHAWIADVARSIVIAFGTGPALLLIARLSRRRGALHLGTSRPFLRSCISFLTRSLRRRCRGLLHRVL
jgi:hypothetical protein